MLVLSHRGYHDDAPENTLAAFEKARGYGASGFETDIRTSSDGIAALYHNRLAPNGRLVSDQTLDDLRHSVGYDIPTLQTVLEKYPDSFWNLELKSAAALAPTLAILKQTRPAGGVLISSFLHEVIFECAQQCDYDCGLIIAHQPARMDSLRPLSYPRNVNAVVIDYDVIDANMIRKAKAEQFKVFVYGMVTRQEHELVAAHEVTGMITDHLDAACAALEQRAR